MKVGIFLAGVGSLFFLTGCGGIMKKKSTEFKWYATESAPQGYPMGIIQGTFYFKGEDRGLYIPSGGMLRAGWGRPISSHVTSGPEKKPLPDRVKVLFFSYTEKQFYKAEFDLPYDNILAYFRKSEEDSPDKPYYSSIMLGVAPGGAVAVWLNGRQIKEVFFGYAEKLDVAIGDGFGLPFESEAEGDAYIEKLLQDVLSPDELVTVKKDGIPYGMWERYRNLYSWVPAYKDGTVPADKVMPASYVNGERNWMKTLLTEEMQDEPRPLPKELKFSVMQGDASLYYVIEFNKVELMGAVERLSPSGEKVFIEFDAQVPIQDMKVGVYNLNDDKNIKDFIALKKVWIEE